VDTLTVMIRIEGETLEEALARIERHGGRTALAPVQIGHSGRFARFTDPEGNSFGLWQPLPKPAPGAPQVSPAANWRRPEEGEEEEEKKPIEGREDAAAVTLAGCRGSA